MGLFKIQRIPFYFIAGVVVLFAGQVIGAPVAIIDQPLKDARITSLPQQVRFHFTEPVNPATVSVKVNGKAQENKFRLTSTSGVGSLGVTEGLRPSLGSRGQLFAPNVIHVQARTFSGTAVNAIATFFLMAPAENAAVVTKSISSTGGALDLSNYANVEFAPNSFSGSQLVSLAATGTAETGLDWDTTAQIFGQAFRTSYEIRVNTGAQAPAQPTIFRMVVPPDFVAADPLDGEVKLFAQVLEDGGQGILDSFEIFDSTLIDGVLIGSLPPQVFTNRRRTDATYEAVVIVGMLRTKPVVSSASMTAAKIGLAEVSAPNSPDARLGRWPVENQLVASMAAISGGDCKGGKLGSPLDNRVMTSPSSSGN